MLPTCAQNLALETIQGVQGTKWVWLQTSGSNRPRSGVLRTKRVTDWFQARVAQVGGKAIAYLLNHWHPLMLFLREKGAPLD